ncbi:MAG: hypothetical protein H6850_01950 [Alphaproteobacteria bacterium]|nr:MAG: hypothetical protein H6850_01950 [Alphaproteobacteria bacterium]
MFLFLSLCGSAPEPIPHHEIYGTYDCAAPTEALYLSILRSSATACQNTISSSAQDMFLCSGEALGKTPLEAAAFQYQAAKDRYEAIRGRKFKRENIDKRLAELYCRSDATAEMKAFVNTEVLESPEQLENFAIECGLIKWDVKTLYSQAEKYETSDTVKSLKLYQKIISNPQNRSQSKQFFDYSLIKLSFLYHDKQDFHKARDVIKVYLELNPVDRENSEVKMGAYANLLVLLRQTGEFADFNRYMNMALQEPHKEKYPARWANIYMSKSSVHILKEEHEAAIDAATKSVEISQKTTDARLKAEARLQLAVAYTQSEKFMQAEKILQTLAKEINIVTLGENFQFVNTQINQEMARMYCKKGSYHFFQDNFKQAKEFFELALKQHMKTSGVENYSKRFLFYIDLLEEGVLQVVDQDLIERTYYSSVQQTILQNTKLSTSEATSAAATEKIHSQAKPKEDQAVSENENQEFLEEALQEKRKSWKEMVEELRKNKAAIKAAARAEQKSNLIPTVQPAPITLTEDDYNLAMRIWGKAKGPEAHISHTPIEHFGKLLKALSKDKTRSGYVQKNTASGTQYVFVLENRTNPGVFEEGFLHRKHGKTAGSQNQSLQLAGYDNWMAKNLLERGGYLDETSVITKP